MSDCLAFLFLIQETIHQQEWWQRFFEGASPSEYDIYIHYKKNSHPPCLNSFFRPHVLPSSLIVPTQWGHISQIHALHNLISIALQNPRVTKMIYVSESCFPLYPWSIFASIIHRQERSFLASYSMNQERYQFLMGKHIQGSSASKALQSTKVPDYQQQAPYISKKKFRKMPGQGWVWNRRLGEFFIQHDDTHYFTTIPCPTEHYFVNVLLHHDMVLDQEVYDQRLTYSNWKDVPHSKKKGKDLLSKHPKTYQKITNDLLDPIREEGYLLIRKIGKECQVDPSIWNKNLSILQ